LSRVRLCAGLHCLRGPGLPYCAAARPGNVVNGAQSLGTASSQTPATAVPPLSFTSRLITVSVAMRGGLSSFVMVQVFVSASARVPAQSLERVLAYPAGRASSTL